jgi:hypothetical protein
MQRIYSSASEVITWISLSIDQHHPAVQLLKYFTELSTHESLDDTEG